MPGTTKPNNPSTSQLPLCESAPLTLACCPHGLASQELNINLEVLDGPSPVLRIGRWGRLNSEELKLEATGAE